MIIFSFEGEPVAAWDAEARIIYSMEAAAALDPDDPTWIQIMTANDPAGLPGASWYRPVVPRMLPLRVGGLDYPNAAQAAADGKGVCSGVEFLTSEEVALGDAWTQIWTWGAGWTAEEGDYAPPVFDPENP